MDRGSRVGDAKARLRAVTFRMRQARELPSRKLNSRILTGREARNLRAAGNMPDVFSTKFLALDVGDMLSRYPDAYFRVAVVRFEKDETPCFLVRMYHVRKGDRSA